MGLVSRQAQGVRLLGGTLFEKVLSQGIVPLSPAMSCFAVAVACIWRSLRCSIRFVGLTRHHTFLVPHCAWLSIWHSFRWHDHGPCGACVTLHAILLCTWPYHVCFADVCFPSLDAWCQAGVSMGRLLGTSCLTQSLCQVVCLAAHAFICVFFFGGGGGVHCSYFMAA